MPRVPHVCSVSTKGWNHTWFPFNSPFNAGAHAWASTVVEKKRFVVPILSQCGGRAKSTIFLFTVHVIWRLRKSRAISTNTMLSPSRRETRSQIKFIWSSTTDCCIRTLKVVIAKSFISTPTKFHHGIKAMCDLERLSSNVVSATPHRCTGLGYSLNPRIWMCLPTPRA